MKRNSKNTEGYIFPIPNKLVEKFFSGEKDVFVKLSRFRYRFLTAGNFIAFYDSDYRQIVGQAKIKNIIIADPSIIWEKFSSRIFLEKEEFDEYVMWSPLGYRRRARTMTAFELVKFSKHGYPRKPLKTVTPSGYYLPLTSTN